MAAKERGMTEAAKTVSSRGRVAWLLAAACLLASPAAAQSLEPAVVVTGDWPPYVWESAPGGGILAELLSAALAGMGRQAEYRFVLFDQAFDLARREGVAGTFPWFRTAQRDETWVYGEEELFDVEYVLFVRRQALAAAGLDSDAVGSVADLDSLRFGGVSGYAYSPAVARRIRPQRRYPTDNAAFEALLEAQIDVVQSDFVGGSDGNSRRFKSYEYFYWK